MTFKVLVEGLWCIPESYRQEKVERDRVGTKAVPEPSGKPTGGRDLRGLGGTTPNPLKIKENMAKKTIKTGKGGTV